MDAHFRKKLIIVSVVLVVVIAGVIVLLIPLSNYIIQQKLERAMGTKP